MDPSLVPLLRRLLLRLIMCAGIRIPLLLLRAKLLLNSIAERRSLLYLPETDFPTPPPGKAPALLHLLLRLHSDLPDAGDFRGRRLGVLESAASLLPGGGEEGRRAAFEAAVGAEATAEGGREGDGAGAVAGGAAGAEDGFGEFHGRGGGGEARGEANEKLACGSGCSSGIGAATSCACSAEMGSIG